MMENQTLMLQNLALKFYNQWEKETDLYTKNQCWKWMVTCLLKAELGGDIKDWITFERDMNLLLEAPL
jgi:hypothetical protein